MKRWGRPVRDRRGMGRRASDYDHAGGLADLGAGSLAALGFLGGMTLGVVLWSRQVSRSKQDLFSSRPLRRLAALGYISGQPSIDNARLLRDYMRWERRPILRRRAEQVLRQVEEYLE